MPLPAAEAQPQAEDLPGPGVGGDGRDRERPCCKEPWQLLQSKELKSLRLRATKGMGKPGPSLSCLEGLVGHRPWPGAELVSLGRRDRTPGS